MLWQRLSALIILCLLLPSAWATVTVYPKKIILGEPVIMVFKGHNIEADFKKISKAALKKEVEIYDVEGDSDRLRLTLYPKHAGNIAFPAMQFGQVNYPGEVIKVAKNSKVSIDWQGPPKQGFPNQFFSWKVTVKVSDSADYVTLEQHPHANTKLQYVIQESPVEESMTLTGKAETFMFAALSDQPGLITIRTPVVRVKNRGARPWLFFDSTAHVNVLPLPSYLPTGTPVGKVTLQVASLPYIAVEGTLIQLNWTLKGMGVPAIFLPNLQPQMNMGQSVEWLTPNIEKSQKLSNKGMVSLLIGSQPFRINQLGWVSLPSFRITYLDSKTQQLKDYYAPSQLMWVVPSWLLMLLQLVGLLLVLSALFLVGLIARQIWVNQVLVYQLKRAESLEQTWQICLDWAKESLGSDANLTIGLWQEQVSQQYQSSDALNDLCQLLNEQAYSTQYPETKAQALVWAKGLPWLHIKAFKCHLKRIANSSKSV